jgi:hypothetical protein
VTKEREGSPLFEVALFLVACARDCLDEPPIFGPRRMIAATSRLIAVAEATGTADPTMTRLGEQISARGNLLGIDPAALAAWLDELMVELSRAAAARNQASVDDRGERP